MKNVFELSVKLPDGFVPSHLAQNIAAEFRDNGIDLTTPVDLRAQIIAHLAHAGQTRISDNQPYHVHTDYVAGGDGFGQFDKVVGHLHDVPEKTSISLHDLLWLGVPDLVIDDIGVMDRKGRVEPYFDGIEHINGFARARKIKMRDIEHNSSDRALVTAQLEAEGNYAALEIRNMKWDFQYPLALAYFQATQDKLIPRTTTITNFMQCEGCPDELKRWDLMKKRHLSSNPFLKTI